MSPPERSNRPEQSGQPERAEPGQTEDRAGNAGRWFERDGQLVLGATVRTLGAFPSGWRHPGAHKDPSTDPRALKRLALTAERAGFDYLFVGDWLSTGADHQFTDPYLLARIDPLSTASYLAGLTRRIGLIATVSASHTEPYAIARQAASIDRLSAGRFGLNLAVGAEPRADANFGRTGLTRPFNRFATASEYVRVLRGLWDGWGDGAFVADAASGELIDPGGLEALDHVGEEFAVAGPLNALRPVQGHVPLIHAGMAPRSREFAAALADVYFVDPSSLGDAVKFYRDVKLRTLALGRPAESLTVVAPLLPIVGETRADAYEAYDRLVGLMQLDDDSPAAARLDLPANRSIHALFQSVGLPLLKHGLDEAVKQSVADRFNDTGRRLLDLAASRSGRAIGSGRPLSYRHLLVAQLTPSPVLVGSATDIADHLEHWYRASAVDGFNILSPFLHEPFESFARLVVPELSARGLFRTDYSARTLRGHLGSPVPPRTTSAAQLAP